MITFDWQGVFPAVKTKFTDSDEIDFDAFDRNLSAQLEAGVDGFILGGSLGEASVLSDDEKFALLKHTVAFVDGKVPVLLNIAEQTTKVAVACAQKALDYGARGLMLLPPMRYKSDDEETVAFFAAVAKST